MGIGEFRCPGIFETTNQFRRNGIFEDHPLFSSFYECLICVGGLGEHLVCYCKVYVAGFSLICRDCEILTGVT